MILHINTTLSDIFLLDTTFSHDDTNIKLEIVDSSHCKCQENINENIIMD
jgi:hypothetical protein